MRIACPSCDTTYQVPDSRLTPGKMVRCARCDNKWLPVREAEDAVAAPESAVAKPDAQAMAAPPDVAPEASSASAASDAASATAPPGPTVTAMDRLTASAVPAHRPRGGLIGAWAATFVVLAGAVAATVVWRDAVVRAWPPSGRILATTGPTTAPPAQTAGRKPE